MRLNGERALRFFPLWVTASALAVIFLFAAHPPRYWPIRSDGVGYYAYLPSYLLWDDPGMLKLYGKLDWLGYPSHAVIPGWSGVSLIESTSRYLDKYNVGTALMILPFFGMAHLAADVANYRRNGFSLPYLVAVASAGCFYLVVGLIALSRVLRTEFSPTVTLLTLIVVTYGTNVLNFAIYESAFSHIYSFALTALLMLLVSKWRAAPKSSVAILMGLCVGLLLLVRLTNAMTVVAVIGLWGVSQHCSLRASLYSLLKLHKQIVLAVFLALLVFLPQMAIWKYVSGHFLLYSYTSEPFEPTLRSFLVGLVGILLSSEKGLLVWFPLLILSLPGFFVLWRRKSPWCLPAAIHALSTLALFASWRSWSLGGGFGHRGFVEAMPLLAFAIAASLDKLYSRLPKITYTLLTLGCLFVTCKMALYWRVLIPPVFWQ